MSFNNLVAPIWTPTRVQGLERLEAFAPHAGRRYAQTRNYDYGPDDRANVSALSPWIRHRLIREDEVLGAVLAHHDFSSAETFIQEVIWRTYWKGWLEMRPAVWRSYREAVDERVAALDRYPDLRSRWEEAVAGATGIDCFDVWTKELLALGYLHNHARMWFASIWIHTLKLPWELGADFFLRHLMDGDAASNTLSWRWVAGLQTPGKTYLARSENIAKYTNGRFPSTPGLAKVAESPQVPVSPPPLPLPTGDVANPAAPAGVLVTEEDGHCESLMCQGAVIEGVAGISCVDARSPPRVGAPARAFAEGAVADAVERAAEAFNCAGVTMSAQDGDEALVDWARSRGFRQVLTAYAPEGPVRERLNRLAVALADSGITLVRPQRPWDRIFWPHASKGFFAFKKKAPGALKKLI